MIKRPLELRIRLCDADTLHLCSINTGGANALISKSIYSMNIHLDGPYTIDHTSPSFVLRAPCSTFRACIVLIEQRTVNGGCGWEPIADMYHHLQRQSGSRVSGTSCLLAPDPDRKVKWVRTNGAQWYFVDASNKNGQYSCILSLLAIARCPLPVAL